MFYKFRACSCKCHFAWLIPVKGLLSDLEGDLRYYYPEEPPGRHSRRFSWAERADLNASRWATAAKRMKVWEIWPYFLFPALLNVKRYTTEISIKFTFDWSPQNCYFCQNSHIPISVLFSILHTILAVCPGSRNCRFSSLLTPKYELRLTPVYRIPRFCQ